MATHRARGLLLLPNLLSAVRLPLALVFVLCRDSAPAALAVLAAAALSDLLDGWYARRFGQATPTGAALDPITDKLFMATVALTLLVQQKLSWWMVLLLTTRDLGELPLVLWWGLSRARRRARTGQSRANALGKVVTALQFAAVAAALVAPGYVLGPVLVAAIGGALAAASYWRRELAPRVPRS